MTGIDPSNQALDTARSRACEPQLVCGAAEALPFASGSFNGAMFVNSLHHVPVGQMMAALAEAARIVDRPGMTVVVEPLSQGSFFSVLRLIDDESDVRRAAQTCIADTAQQGIFRIDGIIEFTRREWYADVTEFLARIVSVDRSRAALVSARSSEIEAAFREMASRDPSGRFVLDQPMRAHVLRRNAAFTPAGRQRPRALTARARSLPRRPVSMIGMP